MTTSTKKAEPVPENQDVLSSWKRIAEHFGCDVRTAKRWEQERALPVYRAPGKKRGTVFAYALELDAWLKSKAKRPSAHSTPANENAGNSAQVRHEESVPPAANHSAELPTGQGLAKPLLFRNRQAWFYAALALFFASAILFWIAADRRIVAANGHTAKAAQIPRQHVPAPGAEELYLRGRYFWSLRTADGLAKALDAYTQAIVKDPSYAEAYAGLAETYDLLPQFGQAELGVSLTKAKVAADRALTLNPNLASAHAAKAFAMYYWDWDIVDSDAEFRRALALDPNSALAHQWYAGALQCRDDPEAVRQADAALRLNPASPAIAADVAYFRADFGSFDAGVRGLKEIERTQPALSSPAWFLQDLAFRTGNYPEYIAEAGHYASITRDPADIALANAVASGWTSGGRIGLLEARARILKAAFDRGSEPGFTLGETLLMLGRRQEALRYFRASLSRHSIQLTTMQDCPWAKQLLSDPGYAALFAEVREREHGTPAHPSVVRVGMRLPQ